MTEWKPEKNISSPWDADVWENNIGQPVKPSGDNLPYPYTTPPLKIGPSLYKLDPKKLAKASQSILPYLLGFIYFHEDYEYFDIIKPYLDIPEKPKTLDDIQQEFDEKIDKLIEKTKEKFEYSKVVAEKRYKYEFDKIIRDFEFAVRNGNFPVKLNLACGIGLSGIIRSTSPETNLYSGIIGSTSPETNLHVDTCFVIKQGNKHKGYYTFGNGRYFKYYMDKKPNFVSRFFMDKLLGFRWVDE